MSDFSANTDFTAPEPEQLAAFFPGYEIEYLIAAGGMGAVYRAVQRSLERTVAIKILPHEFSADAAFCQAFEAEAKAMARLNHPNLIGVYDFGEVGGMLYIIMEYVHGKSLHHSAHGLAIDSKEVIRLVSGIGLGLAHAHEHGILHRDIKPANILLDLNAQPKIGDFGLARPVERQVQEGEEIYGTPHYTAPEVVEAPHSVDHRADIFSLGVLLHELLTGSLPADDPRPPSQIIGCDPRFDQIVRRATYADPQFRYENAADLVSELQAILVAPAIAPKVARIVTPPPAPNVPRKTGVYKTKKSSGFPVGLVFLLLLLAGGGYYYFKKQQVPPAPPEPAVVAEEPALPKPPVIKEKPVSPIPLPSLDPVNPGEQPSAGEAPAESAFGIVIPSMEEEIGPPVFDVNGFLQRGRSGMQRLAKSPISSHEQAMKANCQNFEGRLSSAIRKLSATKRDAALRVLAADYRQWQAAGYRVPEIVPDAYNEVRELDAIHAPALETQKKLDEALAEELKSFVPAYVSGVQKQINTLRDKNDPNAIKLLEREVRKVNEDPLYFVQAVATGNGTSPSGN